MAASIDNACGNARIASSHALSCSASLRRAEPISASRTERSIELAVACGYTLLKGEAVVQVAIPAVGPAISRGCSVEKHDHGAQAPIGVGLDRSAQSIACATGRADGDPALATERGCDFLGHSGSLAHADGEDTDHRPVAGKPPTGKQCPIASDRPAPPQGRRRALAVTTAIKHRKAPEMAKSPTLHDLGHAGLAGNTAGRAAPVPWAGRTAPRAECGQGKDRKCFCKVRDATPDGAASSLTRRSRAGSASSNANAFFTSRGRNTRRPPFLGTVPRETGQHSDFRALDG